MKLSRFDKRLPRLALRYYLNFFKAKQIYSGSDAIKNIKSVFQGVHTVSAAFAGDLTQIILGSHVEYRWLALIGRVQPEGLVGTVGMSPGIWTRNDFLVFLEGCRQNLINLPDAFFKPEEKNDL